MRPLVSARELSKAFGNLQVLKDVTFDIFEHDRIGLIGRNGSGKSTLLRLITREDRPDTGSIAVKPGLSIGSLTQYQTQDSIESVAENLRSSDFMTGVKAELRKIEARMADPAFYESPDYEETMKLYGERQASIARFEGGGFADRAQALLSDLGFDPNPDQQILTLSGGERRKLALAKLLVASPELDLLLLDEPTNHLDIETIEWLEGFLLDYRGSIVVVSHDRYLLDDTVERVFELEARRLKAYRGDYTDHIHQKEAKLAMDLKSYQKYVDEIERNRAIIEKLRGRNKFDAQIKSRLIGITKTARVDDPIIREKVVKFRFGRADIHSRFVVEAKELEMRFGRTPLFHGGTFEIENGDKVGIIGPNGCGKTTLLKLLMGEEKHTGGSLSLSRVIKPGYFDQGHLSLNPENDPIQELQSLDSKMHENDAKALLGRFLFKGDMVRQRVDSLSGGEKARLSILKLVLSPMNLLLLDEPTNHLDIPAQQVVAAAINSYAGTACIVSHDRYFLDSVVSKVLSFRAGRLELYDGNYTNYRARVMTEGTDEEQKEMKYVVQKKFTDWSTGQRYVPGDIVEITEDVFNNFRWALETARLVPMKKKT
jgi:ATP-binding cassette subfamily F protein 3